MNIVICGSMSSSREIVDIAKQLNEQGHETVLPRNAESYADKSLTGETSHESMQNKIDHDLICDYFELIKNSDAVLVVNIDKNGIKNYIGGNSFLEMGFAHVLHKKIFLFNDVPDMAYTDEIGAMQPIILKSDLSKIV